MKSNLLAVYLMLVLVGILVACAAPNPTSTPTTAQLPTAAAKVGEPTKAPAPVAAAPTVPAGQKEVILQGYGGVQEKVMKEEILPPFEKKYGVKATWMTAASGTAAASKIIATKDAPEVDVAYLSNSGFLQLKAAGVLAKIDPARVPNYENIYDLFKDPDRVGACQSNSPVVMVYNTKVFKEKGIAPPTSWYDLWRPELKGRVGILDITSGTTQSWMPLLAKMESGDPKNIDAAFSKLKTLVPSIVAIAPSVGAGQDLFKQGEIWVWNFDVSAGGIGLQNQGFPAEVVIPKEGSSYITNNYVIPKGAPHPELAQELVNYLLGPEAQAAWAKATWFGPCNKTVTLPADLSEKVIYGDKLSKLVPTDWPWIVANYDAWADRWNKEIARK